MTDRRQCELFLFPFRSHKGHLFSLEDAISTFCLLLIHFWGSKNSNVHSNKKYLIQLCQSDKRKTKKELRYVSIIRNDHTSMYFLEGLLILRHEISNQICFWSEREFPDMTNGELSKLIGKFSAFLEKNY